MRFCFIKIVDARVYIISIRKKKGKSLVKNYETCKNQNIFHRFSEIEF